MAWIKENRNTLLFIGFLLLGGILHSRDPEQYFIATITYCCEYLIYASLILSWVQSIDRRLLPTRAKEYFMASACLMLLFLAAQFTKFRIAVAPAMIRYCWYVYYIPILLIPTLFLMTCFRFFVGEDRGRSDELWFLVPAGLLALGVLTNDLHMKAFLPNEDIQSLTGAPRTYTHGFLYYAAYAWASGALVAGILFLLAACRRRGGWKKAVRPLLILVLIPVLLAVRGTIPKDALLDLWEWPEIVFFGMLGVFEACIRSRLIPSNENYPGFFARMELPAMITDRELGPVFRTQAPVRATEEQLRAALQGPVYPAPDTRLEGMEIRAGYAFRTEDESTVNRLNEELRDANKALALENEVLERERELVAEQAGLEERDRLYRKAAREVYPAQKKISGILAKAKPGTEDFRKEIEKALVLTAYVKRKVNFVLVEAERDAVSAKELAAALEESAHYLRCCGLNTVVDAQAERAFPCREAMALYDCFEAAAEELPGRAENLFICLRDHELLMMADACEEALPEPGGFSLPVCRSFEDKQLVLRFRPGGAV